MQTLEEALQGRLLLYQLQTLFLGLAVGTVSVNFSAHIASLTSGVQFMTA